MGFEFLVVIGTVFMLPFVAAGFVAFWAMNDRERTSLEGTWESYAARRVRELVPARGEWPNRSLPCVRWRKDGVRFELSVVGREARARTRLAVWPREHLAGRFVVEPTSTVHDEPPGLAARILDDSGRRALLGFWQHDHVQLRYQRGQLRLEWPGRESNDARIDEAERVLAMLTRRLELSFEKPVIEELTSDLR